MKHRFDIGASLREPRKTVPELRDLLEQVLEATQHDPILFESAEYVRRAIEALDNARAIALTVMREVDAERGITHPGYGDPRKLC